jgi:hypothetical protein
MARRYLGGLLVAAAMLTPVMGGAARAPVVASHNAIYDFYLGGIWAGEMAVDAQFDGDLDSGGTYRARITARTSGIVGFFFTAGVEAETVGRVDANGLSPRRFAADAYERKHRQQVEISYADGSAPAVRAEPAHRVRPWSITSRGQNGVADPLSAAFDALAPGARDAICNQTADVFDGARRWAIEIGPPEPVSGGERIRCDAVYVRIAGFKPKLMGERARRPFTLFFEQREDGLFHVVRASGRTSFGLAVLLLRE